MFWFFKKKEIPELEGIRDVLSEQLVDIYYKIVYEWRDKYDESHWSEKEYRCIRWFSPYKNVDDFIMFRPVKRNDIVLWQIGYPTAIMSEYRDNLTEKQVDLIEEVWKVVSHPLSYLPWKNFQLPEASEKVLSDILENDITPQAYQTLDLSYLWWWDEEYKVIQNAREELDNWLDTKKKISHFLLTMDDVNAYRKCMAIIALNEHYG